ncbi:hypothetical protein PHYSODRAFT_372061, partial [Phytophthora sojae]
GSPVGDNQDIIVVTSGNTTTNMTVAYCIESIYGFRPERKRSKDQRGFVVIWLVVQTDIYLTFKYVSH